MRVTEEDNDNRTIYCGNLSEEVTDEILYELFNQAGPVESVRRPKDQNGRPKSFAFILYKHECSVPYAIELFGYTKLFNRNLNLNSRSTLIHTPILDTHLSEFIVPPIPGNYGSESFHESNSINRKEQDIRNHWNEERDNRFERKHRREGSRREDRYRHSKGRDPDEPTSWAELNALKGKGSLPNGQHRSDLQAQLKRESISKSEHPAMPDYNTLLQMGQQMMLPGMMGMPGMLNMFSPMGLGPILGGNNMFPSMQGNINGGEQSFTDRNKGRRDHQRDGRGARDHPYNERHHRDYRDDHRRHDRGYSSTRSSHDRERRNRRSR
uniref:RRM domain-containing protein n=1 Tax=Cuerna arida TaxID=1464854 RepID=A0A1B6GDE7_9HEMI